jgi:pSer/pThr/pTyr-binding forkhead associated (FHA) protein
MPVILGRSPDNTVVLEGPQVAAHHARLVWIEAIPHLVDLGSQGGTTLKGNRLKPNQPNRLASGESFTIGPYRFSLEVGPAMNLAALDEGGRPLPTDRPAQLVQATPAIYALVVAMEGKQEKFELQTDTVIIGRDPANDIHINHRVVSRYHAQLRSTSLGYEIVDLESTNGLGLQKRRLRRKLLADGDVIAITGRISLTYTITPLTATSVTVERPAIREDAGKTFERTALSKPAGVAPTEVGPVPTGPVEDVTEMSESYTGPALIMERIDLEGKPGLTIGRSADNDLQLNFPTVSRQHARIIQVDGSQQYTIEDLRSSNGTLVNDAFIEPNRPYPLHPGNTIRIG